MRVFGSGGPGDPASHHPYQSIVNFFKMLSLALSAFPTSFLGTSTWSPTWIKEDAKPLYNTSFLYSPYVQTMHCCSTTFISRADGRGESQGTENLCMTVCFAPSNLMSSANVKSPLEAIGSSHILSRTSNRSGRLCSLLGPDLEDLDISTYFNILFNGRSMIKISLRSQNCLLFEKMNIFHIRVRPNHFQEYSPVFPMP